MTERQKSLPKWTILFSLILLIPSYGSGQLSGNYTIGGSNPDFSTISQAIVGLTSNGISGPVIFNIRDGTYPDEIAFNGNAIFGSSSANTITFQSESQNPSTVIINAPTSFAIHFEYASGIIINKLTLIGSCDIVFSNFTRFTNNIYYPCSTCPNDFRFMYSNYNNVRNNIFYGNVSYTYCDYDTIVNNFIHGNLKNIFSDYSVIAFNNFGSDPTYYFNNYSGNCLIENNIMPAKYSDLYWTSTIHYNNYPFGGGQYDSIPFFIDPQYISSTDLHATNPQLSGKGIYYPKDIDDIDYQNRPDPPTLGANEICVSSQIVNSYCGDSIILSLCNMPVGGNFLWNPTTGLNDIHIARPKASVVSSQWYYVNDSILGYSDSIYVNVIPFNVNAGPDDSILFCGNNVMLFATYNAGAIYQWSPIDSLTFPNSNFTTAYPTQTTIYAVTATVAGCSVSIDSVTVFVNPMPIANIYLNSQNNNEICFYNASSCADNYSWNFGDSIYSTDFNPCHIYSDTGLFLVTLIACNTFGCDTFQGYVFVDSLLITNINNDDLQEDFLLFPNPAKNYFTLVFKDFWRSDWLEIYNSLGKCVYTSPLSNIKETKYFDLPTGIYIVKILSNNKVFSKKLVVD